MRLTLSGLLKRVGLGTKGTTHLSGLTHAGLASKLALHGLKIDAATLMQTSFGARFRGTMEVDAAMKPVNVGGLFTESPMVPSGASTRPMLALEFDGVGLASSQLRSLIDHLDQRQVTLSIRQTVLADHPSFEALAVKPEPSAAEGLIAYFPKRGVEVASHQKWAAPVTGAARVVGDHQRSVFQQDAMNDQGVKKSHEAEQVRLREQLLAANKAKPPGTTPVTDDSFAHMPAAPSSVALNEAMSALPAGLQFNITRAIDTAVRTEQPLKVSRELLDRLPPNQLAEYMTVERLASETIAERRRLTGQWTANLREHQNWPSEGALAKQISQLTPGFAPLGANTITHLISAAEEGLQGLSSPPTLKQLDSFRNQLLDVLDHTRRHGGDAEKPTADAIVWSDELPLKLTNIFLLTARDGLQRRG
jgi:hypothetical protein